MKYESLRLEQSDALATIILTREGRPNALDRTALTELAHVMHRCAVDPGIRAVVLIGEGKTFCVGGDLPWLLQEPDRQRTMRDLTTHVTTTISRMFRMPKPVVVGVNGIAGGGGVGLALAGDLCVAGSSSTFTLAHTTSGLTPDAGTTWLLPRLVGLRRAAELALIKRTLTAEEALDWGLVTRVIPDAQLATATQELGRAFAEGPTLAYSKVKDLLRRSFSSSLEEQLEDEAVAIATIMETSDAQEGLMAFQERRGPRFIGR